jgi:hypothetical protein
MRRVTSSNVSKQDSVALTPEQKRVIAKLLREKRKTDPFVRRVHILRMLIDRGIAALEEVPTPG